eukprot:1227438-Rhodomonas_salina.2
MRIPGSRRWLCCLATSVWCTRCGPYPPTRIAGYCRAGLRAERHTYSAYCHVRSVSFSLDHACACSCACGALTRGRRSLTRRTCSSASCCARAEITC